MNKNSIDSAILDIDEKYLDEFDSVVQKKKNSQKFLKRMLPAAACFVVAVALALFIKAKPFSDVSSLNEATGEGQTSAAETGDAASENDEIQSQTAVNNDVITTIADEEKTETEQKGGETSSILTDCAGGTDGCCYKIFNPETDTFAPNDVMTLENRFCAFVFNGKSYYPAENGDISADDYDTQPIGSVNASFREIRNTDGGIEYVARIDIYKLNGVDVNEAVACIISFNGETKAYRYNATDILTPSYPEGSSVIVVN